MTQTPEDKLHQNDQAKRRADQEVEMIMSKENQVIIETRKNVVTMVKYQKNPDQSQKWSLLEADQNMMMYLQGMTAKQGTNIKGRKDRDLKTVSLGLQKNETGPIPMSEGQRAIKMRDHLQKCLRGKYFAERVSICLVVGIFGQLFGRIPGFFGENFGNSTENN